MFNFSCINAMKSAKDKDEVFKSNPVLPALKNAALTPASSSPVLKYVYTKPCDNLNEAENYAENMREKGFMTMLNVYKPTLNATRSVYEVKVFKEQARKK
jgi:hypothetical protein